MERKFKDPSQVRIRSPLSVATFMFLVLLLVLGYAFFPHYISSILAALAVVYIALTIRIQIQRYRDDPSRHNFYPLLGYIFLFFGGIAMMVYRLPSTTNVFFSKMALDYSPAWQFFVWLFFLGFILLGIWAWVFIKVRPFLRVYVIFLAITILVSTLGSLLFTLFVFRVVENNNLELMSQGARTEQLIQQERSDTALFVAQTMADDGNLVNALQSGDMITLQNISQTYIDNTALDTLRVYNRYGEVVASPSDSRDKGKIYKNDPFVSYALSEGKYIKSFDTAPGVLSDVIVTRSVHPLTMGDQIIGAVETGYVFDNAFVDYSKEKTGLEVTVYTGAIRSATTIQTLDGVSRWVGSQETEAKVIENVLNKGESERMAVDRLGRSYYSAFEPIRNINGEVIGMVAVGTPTVFLFEETRQQLLSTFLLLTGISLLIAFVGYFAMQSFRKQPKEI